MVSPGCQVNGHDVHIQYYSGGGTSSGGLGDVRMVAVVDRVVVVEVVVLSVVVTHDGCGDWYEWQQQWCLSV